MEFPRAQCIYHPFEQITNFCRQKTCLLPLCPSCVCTHIDFHMKSGDKPKFDNIQDTFSTTFHGLSQLHDQLHEGRKRMHHLQNCIEKMYSRVSQWIFQAKLQVRDIIQNKFNDLQKDILNSITKHCEITGVYSKSKVEIADKKLSESLKQVTSLLDDLRGERTLASMIMYHGQKKYLTDKVIKECQRELEMQYDFDPKLLLNNDAVELVKRGIGQIIDLKLVGDQKLLLKEASIERQVLTPVGNRRVTQQIVMLDKSPGRVRAPSQIVQINPFMRPSGQYSVLSPEMISKIKQDQENTPSVFKEKRTSQLTDRDTSAKKDDRKSVRKSGISLHSAQNRQSRLMSKNDRPNA